MCKVVSYTDARGACPVDDFIKELDEKAETDKNARVQLQQILYQIERLRLDGTRAGDNFTKQIRGDIWELRPGRNRIFYFGWKDNTIVLLHSFPKKGQKTPKTEIELAEKEMEDWKNRHE